jgi:putative acetyltransferase
LTPRDLDNQGLDNVVKASPKLRWASADDNAALGDVMFDAVRNGASHYTEAQRCAWTPAPRSGEKWDERLASQAIVLAETDAAIVGFMSLAPGGYLDFAYIRPSAQGSGLFRKLFAEIEKRALMASEPRIHTHASLNAKSAFSAVGFSVIKSETVAIGDQFLDRFEMEKLLA